METVIAQVVSDCPSHCPVTSSLVQFTWHSLEHTARTWLKCDEAFHQATVSICGHDFLALHTCSWPYIYHNNSGDCGVPRGLCWGVMASGMHAVKEPGLRMVANLSVPHPPPMESGRGCLETAAGCRSLAPILGRTQIAHRHSLS